MTVYSPGGWHVDRAFGGLRRAWQGLFEDMVLGKAQGLSGRPHPALTYETG